MRISDWSSDVCSSDLDGALPAEQRNDDVAADVGQHAPEQGMRQAVEALQSEQRIGPQQLDTEGTLLDERGGQPARPREGRQQQGVDPGDEAEGEAGQRALARSAEHTSELQYLMRTS